MYATGRQLKYTPANLAAPFSETFGICPHQGVLAECMAGVPLLRYVTSSVREERCRLIMEPVQNSSLYVIIDLLGFSSVVERLNSGKAADLDFKLEVPELFPLFTARASTHLGDTRPCIVVQNDDT
ncbi:hypothetical protein TNCV_2507661 [Trichonephila clavipes]|nr:hypothetical protein TNCV_2507661 [Trichonephila clavipes]